ncbi:hypothetical protein I350_02894 [Cryptococcus amylolentus CBS 6273]|uniref:Ricin B lectin domain-containing protein n=1 Tax=Cryptococcus amylolentus CBS 6273 TaxID=1296118 RepID=A0A1E3K7X8_9TREE|nr:hypothetical protein I350_02894 [Cryptococcus amylolentus CBS 6273]
MIQILPFLVTLLPLLGMATATPINARDDTPTTTISASAPIRSGTVYYDDLDSDYGRRIHLAVIFVWLLQAAMRPTALLSTCKCLRLLISALIDTAFFSAYCQPDNTTWSDLMAWNVTRDDPPGQTSLQTKLDVMCLSAGANPTNGGPVHLQACGDEGQKWHFAEYNAIELAGTDFCLDVKEGSGPINQNPYSIIEELQIWECSDNNDNQYFFQL